MESIYRMVVSSSEGLERIDAVMGISRDELIDILEAYLEGNE